MAKYNLKYTYDQQSFIKRVKYLAKKRVRVELRELKPKASRTQKNYAHVLFKAVAMETGYTLEYVKQEIFKRHYNADIFVYERLNPRNNKTTKELRSSEIIDSKELTKAIEKFRNGIATDTGQYLPAPNEKAELEYLEQIAEGYNYF
jgi:hypothetical protein